MEDLETFIVEMNKKYLNEVIEKYLRYILPFGKDILHVECEGTLLKVYYENKSDEKDKMITEAVEKMKEFATTPFEIKPIKPQ